MFNRKNDLRTMIIWGVVFVVGLVLLMITLESEASAQSIDEYCQTHADASFCSGDSVKECPDGRYIPEDHQDCYLPTSPTSEDELALSCLVEGGYWIPEAQACIDQTPALAINEPLLPTPDEVDRTEHPTEYPSDRASCELDGSCDDSCTPPARDDCLLPEAEISEPQEPQRAELPATGTRTNLLIMAIGFITLGIVSLVISVGLDREYRRT